MAVKPRKKANVTDAEKGMDQKAAGMKPHMFIGVKGVIELDMPDTTDMTSLDIPCIVSYSHFYFYFYLSF